MKRKFRVDIILIFSVLMLVTVTGITIVVYKHNKTMSIDEAMTHFRYESKIFIEKNRRGILETNASLTEQKEQKYLEKISHFMREIDLGKNGMAYLKTENDQVIVFVNTQTVLIKPTEKVFAQQIPNKITPCENFRSTETENCFAFINGDEKYLATTVTFHGLSGQKLTLSIIAPEHDFTGAMQMTLKRILYLAIAALGVGIFVAFLLARQISRPIEILAEDIKRIKDFDFDSEIVIKTKINEIIAMSNAITSMKNSLKAFRLYLPSVLVKQLIASGESIAIGGKEQELTMFFSDIIGFTSISEQMPPQELLTQLSDYFDTITSIVEAEKGTVDKFIGDAVMAFWGAPLPNSNHPIDACRAALRCQEKIRELNNSWSKSGKKPFNTKIGIHTSPVIVGNMGAVQRMNYTVLGDGVNLASRLEGINKIYGTEIIISETTRNYIKDDFICRILDIVVVKGQNSNVTIYELLATRDSENADDFVNLANQFHQIHRLYCNRQWQLAIEALHKLMKKYPEDTVCKIYLKRCRQYMNAEPAADWNGVMHLTYK